MRALAKTKLVSMLVVVCVVIGIGGAVLVNRTSAQEERGEKSGGFSVKTARPVVVSTVPQAGAVDVDPALTEIKVTFSKHMQNGNWAFAQLSKEHFPETTGKPRYEADRRTCVLPVKLEAGKTYVIALNKPPYDSFTDTDRRKAMEYLLVFETRK